MYAHSFVRRTIVPLAIAMIAPLAAQAQESQVFTWSGRVDREIRLTIRGSQMSNGTENNMQTRGRFQMGSALPAQEGTLRVVTETGRGDVQVIQQPNAGNDYTAVVRLVDNEGGADNYRVSGYFMPTNGGRYARGDRGRGRDNSGAYPNDRNYPNGDRHRNRDGDYNRNRDNDRDRDRDRDDRNRDDDRNRNDDRRGGQYGRQELPGFRWSGDVDGEVQLVWRNGNVTARTLSGAQVRGSTMSVTGGSAQAMGGLSVNLREGRGRVDVIQQPTADNRYTGIIRIIDPQRGYGHYDLTAILR